MQQITLEQVKAACRKAYAEKTLLMQNFEGTYGYEVHNRTRGTTSHCAIGTVLWPEIHEGIREHKLGGTILNSQIHDESRELRELIAWEESEAADLYDIQYLHDQCCTTQEKTTWNKEQEKLFLEKIDYKD